MKIGMFSHQQLQQNNRNLSARVTVQGVRKHGGLYYLGSGHQLLPLSSLKMQQPKGNLHSVVTFSSPKRATRLFDIYRGVGKSYQLLFYGLAATKAPHYSCTHSMVDSGPLILFQNMSNGSAILYGGHRGTYI